MPDRLTIRAVETIPVRVPLGRIYRGSTYHMTHRSTLLTRIVTEEGVVGEAYAGDEDADLATIEAIVSGEIAPLLVGEDAFAVERCWERARPATADILRNRRLGLVATACIDAAIWDAVGKALDVPLWKLWGGYRDRLPMIAIAGYLDSPVSVAEEVEELREMGLAGMKLKVGSPSAEQDAARVREARAAGGPDFVLAVDANQKWTRDEALRFARMVEDEGIVWLEEPCRWDNDRRWLRDVRAGCRIPVCAGQSELSAAGCLELMAGGSVDVCNFDSSWSGGPTEWRRAAAAAQVLGVAMGHHEEPQVAAHLLASIPHGTYVECFHPDRDPIWWNLVANRPVLEGGQIALPDAPGLGWELDVEYLEAHALA